MRKKQSSRTQNVNKNKLCVNFRPTMRLAYILVGVFCLIAVSTQEANVHHPAKAAHHIVKHSSEELGHGNVHSGDHHSSHKSVKKSEKATKHDEESAHHGVSQNVHHKTESEEGAGKKVQSHSGGNHQAHDVSGGGQIHGAEMREGSKHKKSQVTKGFREQYHKAERKKHDSFYSNGHKGATWKSFGNKGSKHQSHKYDKTSHGKHLAVKSGDKYGRKSKKLSAHKSDDHKGYKAESGRKSSHDKHEKWGKSSQQKHQDKHKFKYLPAAAHV